jgi:hypothetical protein
MAGRLVEQGNVAAAVALEALWNRLAEEFTFSLICGYTASAIDRVPTAKELEAIAYEHNVLRRLRH